jgi:ABC-type cobalamin/Fe3+-siderophores transport system ATPase subunit
LLLLDEPSNHLDLRSVQALEIMRAHRADRWQQSAGQKRLFDIDS